MIPGVCMNPDGEPTCVVDDVSIECGASTRRKRGTSGSESDVLRLRFKLKMEASSKTQSACASQCEATRAVVLYEDCFSECVQRTEEDRMEALQEVCDTLITHLYMGDWDRLWLSASYLQVSSQNSWWRF